MKIDWVLCDRRFHPKRSGQTERSAVCVLSFCFAVIISITLVFYFRPNWKIAQQIKNQIGTTEILLINLDRVSAVLAKDALQKAIGLIEQSQMESDFANFDITYFGFDFEDIQSTLTQISRDVSQACDPNMPLYKQNLYAFNAHQSLMSLPNFSITWFWIYYGYKIISIASIVWLIFVIAFVRFIFAGA